MQAAALGLAVNLALGAAKLAGGLIADSFALLSDAVNSLGDSLTSLVVLLALWVAQKPADEEHPYGHTRAEAVAASNVALIVMLSALWVGWQALRHFSAPNDVPPLWTLVLAGGNVVIKEALYRYKVGVGRRTGSSAIIANAWDHRSDAFCSLAVLLGLGAVRVGGPRWIWADDAAALIVVAAIVWSSFGIFRRSASELMDVQADDELVQEIRRAAEEVPGVRAIEKLRVRKSGLEYLADMHIEVDAHTTVEEGHRIGHVVKDRLVSRFARLRDVLVHLEPHRPAE
jgi:cation diffusion facilitator family transporter